jgi:hypothetical protein
MSFGGSYVSVTVSESVTRQGRRIPVPRGTVVELLFGDRVIARAQTDLQGKPYSAGGRVTGKVLFEKLAYFPKQYTVRCRYKGMTLSARGHHINLNFVTGQAMAAS